MAEDFRIELATGSQFRLFPNPLFSTTFLALALSPIYRRPVGNWSCANRAFQPLGLDYFSQCCCPSMSFAVSSFGIMLYPDRYAFRLLPGRYLKIIISLPPFLLRWPLLDQMIAMNAVAAAHRPPSSAKISLARLLRIVIKRVTKVSAVRKRAQM